MLGQSKVALATVLPRAGNSSKVTIDSNKDQVRLLACPDFARGESGYLVQWLGTVKSARREDDNSSSSICSNNAFITTAVAMDSLKQFLF